VAYLFEECGVRREVWVVDLPVEVDDAFEFADRPVVAAASATTSANRDVANHTRATRSPTCRAMTASRPATASRCTSAAWVIVVMPTAPAR
jgi:hypothetical protein